MSENITTTRTMTAWRQSRYGGPEIVSAERVDVPAPGDHEVLLRVRATSLNAADHHLLRGSRCCFAWAGAPTAEERDARHRRRSHRGRRRRAGHGIRRGRRGHGRAAGRRRGARSTTA